MPLAYVFAAWKMEAQPVLVLAARDGISSEGLGALIIEHGGDRVAVTLRQDTTSLKTVPQLGSPHPSVSRRTPSVAAATEGCDPIIFTLRSGPSLLRGVRRANRKLAGAAHRRLYGVSFHRP